MWFKGIWHRDKIWDKVYYYLKTKLNPIWNLKSQLIVIKKLSRMLWLVWLFALWKIDFEIVKPLLD